MSGIPYRSEIDGLRAMAILAVLLYHAHLGVRAGLVGVDVFFVISGYLITSLLYQEWLATRRIDLFAFYARRVRRLFPALMLVVITVLAASVWVLSPFGEIQQAARSAAASLLFVGNFFFMAHTGGYFSPTAGHFPLLNMWSLGVEEQFYLLWPLGLLLLLRWRRQSLSGILAACGLVSLALAVALKLTYPTVGFYQMPARFWELALGGMIALRPAQKLMSGSVPALIGLLVVFASVLLPATDFPGMAAIGAVAGTGLLLHAVHGSTELGWTGKFLRSRPMVFIGLISYSLYLWHWPLLALARMRQAGPLSLGLTIALCLAAVVLAWLSYRFVERPFRRPQPGMPGYKVVAAGVTAAAALALASVTLGNTLNRIPPPTDLASRTAADFPANRHACNYREDQSLADFPRKGCISNPGKPVKVAIWGDSFALAWQPFAWALAAHEGVAAVEYSRDGCPPALNFGSGYNYLQEQRCIEFNRLVLGRIRGLNTLIFAARWPSPIRHPDFYPKFAATIQQVSPLVKKIILLGPTPYMKDSVPQCIATHDLAACEISRRRFDRVSRPVQSALQSIMARSTNVHYVKLADFFCTAAACPPLKDGYGLYWDADHASSTAVRAFSLQYLGPPTRDAPRHEIPPPAVQKP